MTAQEIIDKVKTLDLPDGQYIVFGSCPLAAAGLRESGDVDMLVTPALKAKLKQSGWPEIDKGGGDTPLVHDVFDVHDQWNFSSYSPTLEHLLQTAEYYDGVPFASLTEVRKWKAASGRPKDLKDIELIDNYLSDKQK